MDVLRHLSNLYRMEQLSRDQQLLGRVVYGGLPWDENLLDPLEQQKQQFLDRLIADDVVENGEERWAYLSDDEREEVLRHVVDDSSSIFAYPTPDVDFRPLPGSLAGQYLSDENRILLDSANANGAERDRIKRAAHEGTHGYQNYLGDWWAEGKIQPTDPRYKLAEIAALTYPFFLPFEAGSEGAYHGQLLERRADWLNKIIMGRLGARSIAKGQAQ